MEELTIPGFMQHGDLKPLEWLQSITHDLFGLAELWDEYDLDYIDDHFDYYKEEESDTAKIEVYREISRTVDENLLHSFIYDSKSIIHEIEYARESVLKAFQRCAVFPNLLSAIGLIETVIKHGKSCENDYYYNLYFSIFSTQEEAEQCFGKTAAKVFKQEHELTTEDYDDAFGCILNFLEVVKQQNYSNKLREIAWPISGYCKLKAQSRERYDEIEAEIENERVEALLGKDITKEIAKALGKERKKRSQLVRERGNVLEEGGHLGGNLTALSRVGVLKHERPFYWVDPLYYKRLGICPDKDGQSTD